MILNMANRKQSNCVTHFNKMKKALRILWHVDTLLGSDREISNFTSEVPQTSVFPLQQENTSIMEETFSTRSVQRSYKQDQQRQ
jgi:hypothetical protein